MPNLDEALSYLEIGWSVIPCRRDKRPYIPWAKYQKTKPTKEEIQKWWTDWPEANIAVITGKISGIVAIDIDSPKGEVAYRSLFGEVHKTIRQTTGKEGGCHLLFKYPQGSGTLGNTARQAEDVDTRADGGYILIDPSIHPSGKKYQWVIDPRESPDDLMDLPQDIQVYFWPDSTTKKSSRREKDPDWVSKALEGVDEGERDNTCTELAGYYLRVLNGDIKQTEDILLNVWNPRNRPPMDWKDIRKVVLSIAAKEGRNEAKEKIGSFIEKMERHIYPDGTYKYVAYIEGFPGSMTLTDVDICDQRGFIHAYFRHTKKILLPMKKNEWVEMMNKVMKESIDVNVSKDQTTLGAIMEILRKQLQRPETDRTMITSNRYVLEDGKLFFKLSALLSMLKNDGEKTLTRKSLGALLRLLNADEKDLKIDGKAHSVWYIDINDIEQR